MWPPQRLGTLHSTWERALGGWDSSEGNQKNKQTNKCLRGLIYYKYSTNTSISPLAMLSSGKFLHAFASVRDCQCRVTTYALFLQEDMWTYACVSPLQCALSLLAYNSRGPNSHLSLSVWWNTGERSCSGFSAPSDFSAIKTRVAVSSCSLNW